MSVCAFEVRQEKILFILFANNQKVYFMKNPQKDWKTPDMTAYGSVEELTSDKDLGGDDGQPFQSQPIAS